MDTIKSSIEISHIFEQGKRLSSPYLTIIVMKSQHDHEGRVAFIAGKKLGNAVWRNGAKRRMRAIQQDLAKTWKGYDVIFLAKSSISRASYSKVLSVSKELLERALHTEC